MSIAYTLFDTPLGRCGIAWGSRGIAALQLPEASESATRAKLLDRIAEAQEASPPAEVQRAIDGINALLRGQPSELAAVPLDLTGVPRFHARVYEVVRRIPPGASLSYGEVAARAEAPGAARAVGQAMRRNPFSILVPCHRVFAAGGKIGGYSAHGGLATKLKLLSLEAAAAEGAAALFEGDGVLPFDAAFAMDYLRDADPALGRLFDTIGPFRMQIRRAPSIFIALAEAIVYQQLNGKAAASIFARLRALYPRAHQAPTAAQILKTSDQKLRGVGLSRSKLLSLKDLAKRDAAGAIPDLAAVNQMENEAIIEQLTQVRGIGRWTVEMLLIFRLGRPDVLPLDDFGVRKGFGFAFKRGGAMPAKDEMEKRGRRWKPYRTVASWYLWRAAELATQRERARKQRLSAAPD
ncbi:MAG TPA: methylated-DNA--[protein]-cysteine S-methyltransferase [Stellaceae bacterium]|nr:methylated-DNA--[protein]-cysteine S-methyltransferase [Stellaceae bacterium]